MILIFMYFIRKDNNIMYMSDRICRVHAHARPWTRARARVCVCVQSSTETTVSNIIIIIITIIIIIIIIIIHVSPNRRRRTQCNMFPPRQATSDDVRYASVIRRRVQPTNNIARLPSTMVLMLFNSRNIFSCDTSSSVCERATDGWAVNKSLVNNRPLNKTIGFLCH
jgi:hypothetical protein